MENEKKYIEDNIENILNDLKDLVAYKSTYSDDLKPFGSENRKALDYMLEKMKKEGFNVKNLDYYAGYGEVGSGKQLIGILGHLDVVPAGEGWDSDPFKMVIKDGKCYGRGVTDDKGGVISSYYALKYLIDTGYTFNKRVRMILGCNEESGFNCIDYYVEKEGHIDYGFTPDGSWPGIYGEKGVYRCNIITSNSKIKLIKGGEAVNAVCNKVNVLIAKKDLNIDLFVSSLKEFNIKYNIEILNDDYNITVFGTAAHASMPELGKNAISYLFYALNKANFNDELTSYYVDKIGLSYNGENGNINFKDDYGVLTLNVGKIYQENENIIFTIDIRFPVTFSGDKIKDEVVKNFSKSGFIVENWDISEPLFKDPNSPMLLALKDAYQKVTNDKESQMMVIGGGTYAKGIKNCIAFGPEFPGIDYHIHDVNEEVSIEDIKKNILIYIQALKNLNEME